MRVSIIVEDSPAKLSEAVNFFIADITREKLVDIKFTTDVTDTESWYNAMIIYDKK